MMGFNGRMIESMISSIFVGYIACLEANFEGYIFLFVIPSIVFMLLQPLQSFYQNESKISVIRQVLRVTASQRFIVVVVAFSVTHFFAF